MHLTQQQRDHLAGRLREERERVLRALSRFAERSAAAEREVERRDGHAPFQSGHETDAYNQALDALELSRLTRELGEIDEASKRLELDPERFGRDELTGMEIPFERLELIPWARTRTEDPHGGATNIVAADSDVLSAYRNERYAG
jgi:RNA polymerase-binding transcription factor DksA